MSARTAITLCTLLLTCLPSLCLGQARVEAINDIVGTGDILYQQPHTATFTLRNATSEPISLLSVTPACGCTAVEWDKGAVAPGATTEIRVTYDAMMLGTFQKEVEVVTTAAPDEPIYLTLQGRVVTTVHDYSSTFPYDLGEARLSTRQIAFGDITIGQRAEVEIGVLNASRSAYRPTLMHLPPYITATCQPETLPAGRAGRITLRLNSERMKHYGLNTTTVYLSRRPGDKVGRDNEITISSVLLPSFAHLTAKEQATAPVLTLSADTLDFGSLAGRRSLTRTLTIGNAGERQLTVQSVQVIGSGVDVRLSNRSVATGKQVRLKVTLHADAFRSSPTPPAILLITNDPAHAKTLLRINAQ